MKDFGNIYVKVKICRYLFNTHTYITDHLISIGFLFAEHNVCGIRAKWKPNAVDAKFKIVHNSIKNIKEEPYYKISFKKKEL